METTLSSEDTAYEGLERMSRELGRRRDDGWLAVFFEFWAHVLRHPELRERFVELHRRGARSCRPVAGGDRRRARADAARGRHEARHGQARDGDRPPAGAAHPARPGRWGPAPAHRATHNGRRRTGWA